jgi:two-component sensor histidine kinase/ABC-type uncharacterized transport system substrate-binding protein
MRVKVACLVWGFCIAAAASAAPTASKQVLIIHSYQQDYQWTRLQHSGIMSELDSSADQDIRVKTEYLDAKHSWNAEKAREFARHLAVQYANNRFDLLMVTDDDALAFVDEYGTSLFASTPVVFSGINDHHAPRIARHRGHWTGVAEFTDYESTIAALRALFPQATEVRLLADDTTTGRQTSEAFLSAVERSKFPLPVSTFPSLELEDVLAEAKKLPPSTAVMLLSYARDSAGSDYAIPRIVSSLAQATAGPIFSVWDFNFGYGIVGGALTSGFAQGREAGRLALRILGGEAPGAVPISELRNPTLTFDWRVLKRFGIPAGRVPAGSEVLFRPQSLYERNPETFLIVAGIISILAFAVIGLTVALLVIQRAQNRLRASDQALSKSLSEKNVLLKEVHHRVKNNFQVISSLLHLQSAGVEEENARAALMESDSRVRSMALIHERLYEEKDFSAIDFGEYARALADQIAMNYADGTGRVALEVEADATPIALDRSVPLGLLLNELLTNAYKYAFPDGRTGTIRVAFRAAADGGYRLSIGDDGVGLPDTVDVEEPRSLGLQLVRVLADQAGAKIAVDRSAGTRFDILVRERA